MRVQAKLPDAPALSEWGNSNLNKPSTMSLSARLAHGKRNAVYRRKFFCVPRTGPQQVKRTHAEVKLDGSAKIHSFVDIGKPGSLLWRERSCHQCQNCFDGKPSSG
eukprot:1811146-Prymnesium_polylepis.1